EGGVYWLEEPIRHDDYRGYATLVHELKVPIQIGENFSESDAMLTALDAGACDYVMPDLERIGGVTGKTLIPGRPMNCGSSFAASSAPTRSRW
ncbi:MAG: hypothetical protein HC788_10830, partial [Sphingopyxis sp.]|nr:hypothetical protein [Sphingopyxis sp.]